MNNERLQILKMVQEGKLSADEAGKLIDALEQPQPPKTGAKPTHIRVVMTEGGKPKSFSVGLGLARWVLAIPGLVVFDLKGEAGRFHTDQLLEAIDNGKVGKVFEAHEGSKRVEIWLDA